MLIERTDRAWFSCLLRHSYNPGPARGRHCIYEHCIYVPLTTCTEPEHKGPSNISVFIQLWRFWRHVHPRL